MGTTAGQSFLTLQGFEIGIQLMRIMMAHCLVLFVLCCMMTMTAFADRRPNVIVIYTDDQGPWT